MIGIANATAIAASNFQTCALLADGGVSCWGFNGEGQLGNGTTTDSSVPVLVTGITDATAVAIGNSHSCALLADGGVSCWGRNDYGLLGDGTTINSSVSIPVTGITDATAIASHGYHSCALLADGGVSCWGINQWGQLGNGTASWFSNVPVEVSGLSNATGLAVGYAHACAIVDGGGAVCWGQGGYGQLGDGVRPSYALVPVAVAGMTDATALIAGDRHTCAILGNGDMSCWGSNWFGQLGNGTNDESIAPIAVPGITGVTDLAAGTGHTCVIVDDEAVSCWGYNYFGQLGNGTTMSSNVPVPVPGFS
ncbi:MAG: hypothetical protein IPH29_19590 [Candidatus Microthrix sp.]|nr:hypothetical protein [Candidatus Microthrix sp.]